MASSIMILCPVCVCPVASTDWKYFSGTFIYVFVAPHVMMPGTEATCALSLLFLKVVEVVELVGVVMEHVPIDQEVC